MSSNIGIVKRCSIGKSECFLSVYHRTEWWPIKADAVPYSCDSNCIWPKRFLCAVICVAIIIMTAGISVSFWKELPSMGVKMDFFFYQSIWKNIVKGPISDFWKILFFSFLSVSSGGAVKLLEWQNRVYLTVSVEWAPKSHDFCVTSSLWLGRLLVKSAVLVFGRFCDIHGTECFLN